MINRLQIGCMRTYFITVRLVRFASYSIAKYLIRYTRSYEACVARLQNQIMKFWVLRSLRSLFPDPSDNQLVVRCFWWNLQANYTRTQVLLTHSRKAGRRNLRNCPSLPPSSAILSFDVRKHFLEIHLETKQNQSLLCCTPTYSFHFFSFATTYLTNGLVARRLNWEKHSRPPWRPVGYCLQSRARTKRSSSTQTFTFRGRQCPRRGFG